MTKLLLSSFLLLSTIVMNAQITAQDFNKMDCNGTAMHHLFADLDSGHAVLLHYFMPSCGSCPPAAKVMQRMAKGINAMYPGMVIGYAMPLITPLPAPILNLGSLAMVSLPSIRRSIVVTLR